MTREAFVLTLFLEELSAVAHARRDDMDRCLADLETARAAAEQARARADEAAAFAERFALFAARAAEGLVDEHDLRAAVADLERSAGIRIDVAFAPWETAA